MKTEKETSPPPGNEQSDAQTVKQDPDQLQCSMLRTNSTVLTNLQRGNIKTQQSTSYLGKRTIYELAAQGELSPANIKNHLDKLNQRDSNGFTPLIWASNYGQLSTCRLLLKHNASVSSKGNHGETALLFAAANGHIHVLKLLIGSGADVNQYDEDGNTALIYSSFNNHELCVQELLNCNADLTIQNINLDTAYSLAVKNSSTQSKVLIEKHILKNAF